MGILYLPTKFELDLSTNNGDLLSEGNHWKIQTDTQTDTHTEIESDTLPIQDIGSSKNTNLDTISQGRRTVDHLQWTLSAKLPQNKNQCLVHAEGTCTHKTHLACVACIGMCEQVSN